MSIKETKIDSRGVYWYELVCVKCQEKDTFGTASIWTDGALTGLIKRLGWTLEPEPKCPKCTRKHSEEL